MQDVRGNPTHSTDTDDMDALFDYLNSFPTVTVGNAELRDIMRMAANPRYIRAANPAQ